MRFRGRGIDPLPPAWTAVSAADQSNVSLALLRKAFA